MALLWQGTVLDVVTLKRKHGTLSLRTGEVWKARVVDGGVQLLGRSETVFVEAGALVELPAGHSVVVTCALSEARVGGLHAVDSTLFHAAMIGAAVQACVVSALVLAPAPAPDLEAGGGMQTEWRRLLVSPGGTAPSVGQASVQALGRKPEEAEVPDAQRARGQRPRIPAGKGVPAEQALEEMRRALHLGDEGTMQEALGELVRAAARAPVLGADVGGLSPRDLQSPGAGNGLIGAGESRISEMLRRRVEQVEKSTRLPRPQKQERAPIPVSLVDVPSAQVTLAPDETLDPAVKDQLSFAVRQRHNAVRYCYESWGLAADATRSGRLVLEITLMPDGRIADPKVTVDGDGLKRVADCVERMAADWYLGDGLVDEPKRLAFPFILQPHKDGGVTTQSIQFDDELIRR